MMPRLRRAAAAILLVSPVFAPGAARAANLVPNPSFETLTSCPTAFSQLYQAAPWDVPTAGTSDCYNTCVVGWPSFPVPAIPQNPFGIQTPRTGNGMAGMIVKNINDYREYMQVPLASTLASGQSYLVKFYVNLADTCDTAIDRIGAYLSAGPIGPLGSNTPIAVPVGTELAAASTAATPDALSTAPSERLPTTLAITGSAPTTPAAMATHSSVRDMLPASVTRSPATARTSATASSVTPATRTAEGTGCDLLSRWATSHTRRSPAPRVATRLRDSARSHGAVSTPSRIIQLAKSVVATTPVSSTATAATSLPSSTSALDTTTVPPIIAPAIGVAQRPGKPE